MLLLTLDRVCEIAVLRQENSYISQDCTYSFAKRCKTTVDQRPVIERLDPWHGDITRETVVIIYGYGFGKCKDDIQMVHAGPTTLPWKWKVVDWISPQCIIVLTTPLPSKIFKWDRPNHFIQPIDVVVVTRAGGASISRMKWVWTLHSAHYSFTKEPPSAPIMNEQKETKSDKKHRKWTTAQSSGTILNHDHSVSPH
jgi:hypothetical protein